MKVRKLKDAERDALRREGSEKANLYIQNLRDQKLSPQEFNSRLDQLIQNADNVAKRCHENFNKAREYCPKDGQHLHDLTKPLVERMYLDGIRAEGCSQRLLLEQWARNSQSGASVAANPARIHSVEIAIALEPTYK